MSLLKFALICLLGLATLASLIVFGSAPIILIGTLVVLAVCMIAVAWDSKWTLLVYILVAISGPAAEAIAIYFTHPWVYSETIVAGVPLYLPFLWGNAAMYIIGLKKYIDSFNAL